MEKSVLEKGVIRLGGQFVDCASVDFTENYEVIIRDTKGDAIFLSEEQWDLFKQEKNRTPESKVRYFETWEGWDVTIDFTHPEKVTIVDYFDEEVALTRKEWEQLKKLFF